MLAYKDHGTTTEYYSFQKQLQLNIFFKNELTYLQTVTMVSSPIKQIMQ